MIKPTALIALALLVLTDAQNATSPAPVPAASNGTSLTACDADKLKNAMQACDSLPDVSQIKCDNTACHKALHTLVDPDYIACVESLKLGTKADLAKYKQLDDFCHGEGEDPTEHEHEHGSEEHEHDHDGSHDHGSHDHDHDHSDASDSADAKVPSNSSTVPTSTPAAGSSASSVALAGASVAIAASVAASL